MTSPTKKRVLVIDDEKTIADTLAIILNRAGFEAFATYSGLLAIELAQRLQPDLVISDILMPELDGIETVIRIRQLLPACKVLLFSAQADSADLGPARARGHEFEILAKPLHPRELIHRIEHFC